MARKRGEGCGSVWGFPRPCPPMERDAGKRAVADVQRSHCQPAWPASRPSCVPLHLLPAGPGIFVLRVMDGTPSWGVILASRACRGVSLPVSRGGRVSLLPLDTPQILNPAGEGETKNNIRQIRPNKAIRTCVEKQKLRLQAEAQFSGSSGVGPQRQRRLARSSISGCHWAQRSLPLPTRRSNCSSGCLPGKGLRCRDAQSLTKSDRSELVCVHHDGAIHMPRSKAPTRHRHMADK